MKQVSPNRQSTGKLRLGGVALPANEAQKKATPLKKGVAFDVNAAPQVILP
jgi:hypothetical protein